MTERKTPTIEEIIDTDAFEAQMHFLLPENGYQLSRAIVSEPTPKAVGEQLENRPDATLVWASFTSYEYIGRSPYDNEKYVTRNRKLTDFVLSSLPYHSDSSIDDALQLRSEVSSEDVNAYHALLLELYGLDRKSQDFFHNPVRPIQQFTEFYRHPQFALATTFDAQQDVMRPETQPERLARMAERALDEFVGLRPWITHMLPTS